MAAVYIYIYQSVSRVLILCSPVPISVYRRSIIMSISLDDVSLDKVGAIG